MCARGMRRFLVMAVFAFALSSGARARGAEPRPVVRVVLLAPADSPGWLDGFVKHLRTDLALRGIDVVLAPAPAAAFSSAEANGNGASTEAQLVVDARATARTTLRFDRPSRAATGTSPGPSAPPTRTVDLSRIPGDGRALALEVAADELMRSTWPRAIPAPAKPAPPAAAPAPGPAPSAPTSSTSGAASTRPVASPETAATTPPKSDPPPESPTREASPPTADPDAHEGDKQDDPPDEAPVASVPPRADARRVWIAPAFSAETFGGGQTQFGPDARIGVRVAPALEVSVRGGIRSLVAHDTSSGTVNGSAFIAGVGAHLRLFDATRTALSVVGRVDMMRVRYVGQARDATITAASEGSATAWVAAAGPAVRVAIARSISCDGEVLVGGSPQTANATDATLTAVSTRGVALLASLGLSVGF